MVKGALTGLYVLIFVVMIVVVVPCILWCMRQMIDRTMKEAFVIQERDVGNEITERSRDLVQLPADPKVVYANVNFGKGFSSRLWNR